MAEPVAVIFDMDGVLVDSAQAHRRAWQQLGDEVGVPFSAQLFQETFGQRNATILPRWLGDMETPRLAALERRKESLYRDFVRQGAVRIYAGVGTLLDVLRRGDAKTAIASSGPRENVELLIPLMDIADRIDATVTAEDVRHGKPDPEVFLIAAARLRVPRERCAVIEDSVHGIEAARRAGMLAVAVLTSTARPQLVAAGADWCVQEIGALDGEALLARLQQRAGARGA